MEPLQGGMATDVKGERNGTSSPNHVGLSTDTAMLYLHFGEGGGGEGGRGRGRDGEMEGGEGRMEEGGREIIKARQLVTSFLQGATQLWERETENKPNWLQDYSVSYKEPLTDIVCVS